jgi:hypothetical protein
MLIESIIRRKNGTEVSFGEATYKFEPKPLVTQGDKVAHVCSVNDQGDIDILLSIVEGFRRYKSGVERKPMAEDELTAMLTLGLRKIKPEIALMSAAELDMVEEMEAMGSKRQTLFDYISLERQKRLNNGIPI